MLLFFEPDLEVMPECGGGRGRDWFIMMDQDCIRFLQWSLPKLRMRWKGFRKVRRRVCRRIDRRMRELGLTDVFAYQAHLENNADEWPALDSLCHITISRFYRDREVFRSLEREVLVKLSEDAMARGEKELRCWCIGCASGEEPYTLATLWDFGVSHHFPFLKMSIIATDADNNMIERAKKGCYASSSLDALPLEWTMHAFTRLGNRRCIRAEEREKVVFLEQDVRVMEPEGYFHLILCRNLALTYFDEELQRKILSRLRSKLYDQGALVIGIHESFPSLTGGFLPWPGVHGVYVKETNE